ncbi:MAG: hypothetical protein ACLUJG_01630 [Lawsonibacter sp.]
MADKLVRAALEQHPQNGGTPAATCTYAVSSAGETPGAGIKTREKAAELPQYGFLHK